MKPCLTILLFFLTATCFAQYKITGIVYDADDKKPLPGVNVFLNNTTNGTQSNPEGTFSINNVKPGQYELIVSMVGYQTFHYVAKVNDDIKVPQISLKTKATSLSGVNVKPRPVSKRNISDFKDELIGRSDFAKQCEIINPNVIDINYNSADKILTASTSGFLIIENKALGYKVKYLVNDFIKDEKKLYVYYEGYVQFEPLEGNAAQQQIWRRNRMVAYNGSSRHFLRAVLANDIQGEGFKMYKLSINRDRPSDSLINAKLKQFWASGMANTNISVSKDSLNYWRAKQLLPNYFLSGELSVKAIIHPTDQRSLYAISYPEKFYIGYKINKRNMAIGSMPNFIGAAQTYSLGNGETVLTIKEPFAFFDINGVFINPSAIHMEGYWGRQRVAELLPTDFEPTESSL
ncbi:hypothetical protein GCM10023149_38130 [Mucilaginibacter gynuensis]|uniref:Carboxypeptidase-like regulatory domain-containing protein n=1 Tax=Mucilaginibacter gynuensis TaxID=1302236 RepID=A0ABP8GZC2_9SPHI